MFRILPFLSGRARKLKIPDNANFEKRLVRTRGSMKLVLEKADFGRFFF
jgi:hypothetical protein